MKTKWTNGLILYVILHVSIHNIINSCAHLIFNENIITSHLQRHSISSLMTCLLVQGRDKLSLT